MLWNKKVAGKIDRVCVRADRHLPDRLLLPELHAWIPLAFTRDDFGPSFGFEVTDAHR